MRRKIGPREAAVAPTLTVAATLLDPPSSKSILLHVAKGDLRIVSVSGAVLDSGASVPITLKSGDKLSTASPAVHLAETFASADEPEVFYVTGAETIVKSGHLLWFDIGALSGAPTQLHITVEYETIC